MKISIKILLIFALCSNLKSQTVSNDSIEEISFFQPSPRFSQKRFYSASAFLGLTYSAFSYGFYNSWYKDYPMSSFHLFNDWGEWEHMDKAGHVYSGYFQSLLTYKGARWTGLNERQSIYTGVGIGMLFQTTIEVLDGFSTQWGFSIPDMAANTIGVGAFALQQLGWHEQRITIKESAWPKNYSNNTTIQDQFGSNPISLKDRAGKLYGTSLGEKLLKDYNAQTYWLSFNIHSFLPEQNRIPKWMNITIGYGADNMYGGFDNKWSDENLNYDASHLKRVHQFYLSLDADLTRVQTNNHFLKSILSVLNIFKLPAPAIEFNSNRELIFHFIHY